MKISMVKTNKSYVCPPRFIQFRYIQRYADAEFDIGRYAIRLSVEGRGFGRKVINIIQALFCKFDKNYRKQLRLSVMFQNAFAKQGLR